MSSSYVGNRDFQRQVRFPENGARKGIPSDDWSRLERAQRRDDLEDHFYQDYSKSQSKSHSKRRPTAYEEAGLSRDRRLEISAVQNATRSALGASFDPYDEDSYEPSRRRNEVYGKSRGWDDDESDHRPTMPQRYRDEYERIFSDKEDGYEDDRTFNAAWRDHDRMYSRDQYRGESSTHSPRPSPAAVPKRRPDSRGIMPGVYDSSHRRLNRSSRWSEDSSIDEPPGRRIRSLFRH